MTDFSDAERDKPVFSNNGFDLGQSKASATPKALPAGLFSTRANGTFDKPGESLSHVKSNSDLYPDADGNSAGHSRLLVATLASQAAISAGNLFFAG